MSVLNLIDLINVVCFWCLFINSFINSQSYCAGLLFIGDNDVQYYFVLFAIENYFLNRFC